jgi:hypothetical protein
MSTTPVIASEAPQAPGPINHFGRIIGVFFSPKATIEDIVRRPSWIIPMVLMTVLGIVVAFVMNQKVDWRDVASKRIEVSPRAANLSAEQKEQQIAMSAKFSPGAAYAFGALGPILAVVVAAGNAARLQRGRRGKCKVQRSHGNCFARIPRHDTQYAFLHLDSVSETTRHHRP